MVKVNAILFKKTIYQRLILSISQFRIYFYIKRDFVEQLKAFRATIGGAMKLTKLSLLAVLMSITCLSLKATDQTTNTATADNQGHHHKAALDQLYSLRMDNGWGFVDGNNSVAIPGYFDDAEDFSEGLGQVMISDKWGFVNRNGKIVIPPMYDYSEPFTEGLSAVCKGDKWGYIDAEGKVKIDFIYKTAGTFHEGFAAVSETGKKDSFGFINKNGRYVIPTGIYDGAKIFSEGLAPVMDNDKWGYINTQGKIVIPLAYEEAQIFSKDLAAVRSNGKWGYIDKNGKTVIKFEYGYASLFTDNGAIVSKNEESFMINHEGQLIPLGEKKHSKYSEPQYHSIQPDWMNKIKYKNALVYTLDLPGTHDSATYAAGSTGIGNWYKCQDLNITKQLEWGIRVLDIRLKMNSKENKQGFRELLTTHGGSEHHTYDSFDKILDQCIKFLKEHSNETIVMIVKSEGSPDIRGFPNFNDSVELYIKEACGKNGLKNWEDRFPDTSNGKLWNITVDDARGKILLVSAEDGINKPGWIKRSQQVNFPLDGVNSNVSKDTLMVKTRIADEWLGETKKQFEPQWKFIETKKETFNSLSVNMKKSQANNDLLIMYLSASYRNTPLYVARTLMSWFARDEEGFRKNRRCGWFMMDFVGGAAYEQDWKIRDDIINDSIYSPRCCKVSIPQDIIIDNLNPKPNTLHTEFKLLNGHAIVSSGDKPKYGLIMQPDNNLVLDHFIEWYDNSNRPKSGFAIWSSGSGGKGKAYADLQSDLDGNFVIYTEQGRKNPIWSSGTNSKGDNLILQDDGNLVIYNQRGTPIWASCTDGK